MFELFLLDVTLLFGWSRGRKLEIEHRNSMYLYKVIKTHAYFRLFSAEPFEIFVFFHVSFCIFLCPRDNSQGALRFAPVCPSVSPSVRPFVTLYGIEFV